MQITTKIIVANIPHWVIMCQTPHKVLYHLFHWVIIKSLSECETHFTHKKTEFITCSKSNAIYIAEPGFGFNSISKGWALKHYALLLHRILALEGTQQIIRLNPYSLQMRTPRPREGAWLAHMTNKNATNFTEHQDPLHNLRANVVPGHPSPKSGLRLLFSVSPASLLLVTGNFWIHPVIQWPNYIFWTEWNFEFLEKVNFHTIKFSPQPKPMGGGIGARGREATRGGSKVTRQSEL